MKEKRMTMKSLDLSETPPLIHGSHISSKVDTLDALAPIHEKSTFSEFIADFHIKLVHLFLFLPVIQTGSLPYFISSCE